MNRIIKGIILIFIAALASCGQDSKVASAASTVITHYLLSPVSYSEKSSKIVWNGKNRVGKDAYMVNVVYDSSNGFGAIVRECKTAVFTIDGDKVEWVDGAAVNGCFDTNDRDTRELMRLGMFPTEQSWLSMLASSNNIDMARVATTVEQKLAVVPIPVPAAIPSPEPVLPPRNFQLEATNDLQFINSTPQLVGKIDLSQFPEKHPATIATSVQLDQKFRLLMGKDFEEFRDSIAVASPVEVQGDAAFFGSGMAAHSGGQQAGAYMIDKAGRLFVVMIDKDQPKNKTFRIYGAGDLEQLPEKLRSFISEARQ